MNAGGQPRQSSLPGLPVSVVATRAGQRAPWRHGTERDAAHLQWQVRTEDPELVRRNRVHLVRFDSELGAGQVLSAAAFSSDRAIKRALCLDALDPLSKAGALGGKSLTVQAYRFDWVLRWRLFIGVGSFRELTRLDLGGFIARLASGGVEALVSCQDPFAMGEDIPVRAAEARRTGRDDGPADRAGKLAAGTLRDYFALWDWLWRASEAGVLQGDRLAFDPSEGGGMGGRAERLGRTKGRTATLTPPQFLRVLRAAAAWVLPRSVGVVGGIPCAPTTEVEALRLMAACAILVGAFAARRGGEVGSLRQGCASVGSEGPWLAIYIEKTDQDVRRVPAHGLIGAAVRALEELSAPARAVSGEPWLFQALVEDRLVAFDPGRDLAAFGVAAGLHEGEHALAVPLASHQLRRAFAMVFYHFFQLGSLEALTEMLRHRDGAATRIYISEAEDGAALSATDAHRVRVARSMAMLDDDTSAWLASELARLEGMARRGLPLDRARCEDAALELLQRWRLARGGTPDGEVAPSASPRVRLGAQSRPPGTRAGRLLDEVRAYAGRVVSA